MFKTGNPVTGKDFIDRKNHLPLFKTYIDQNQSFMIKAPRRFGKTSIIKHLLESKKEYEFVYIDIKRVSTLTSLANYIIDSAYKISSIDNFLYKLKNSMFDLIKSIQKIKLDSIAEVTIKIHEKDNIDEVVHILDSYNLVPVPGEVYDAEVVRIMDFGAFVKIAPGKEGWNYSWSRLH